MTTTDEPTTEPVRPGNVIQAINRVMDELPGIGKKKRQVEPGEREGLTYAYRGIEAITSECQPLFAKYGVVFVPRVLARFTKDFTINNKPWTEEQLTVEYDVYGPGGVSDKIVVGPIVALGRDNSDKGTNKCMTQAFKYALLQVLCIADEKDDNDGTTHAADGRAVVDPARVRRSELATRVRALPESVRPVFKAWVAGQGWPEIPKDFTDDQCAAAEEWVDNANAEDEAAQARVVDGPHADRYAAASAFVNAITDRAEIVSSLTDYGVAVPRNIDQQKEALVAAIVADDAWCPMPQESLGI